MCVYYFENKKTFLNQGESCISIILNGTNLTSFYENLLLALAKTIERPIFI